MKRSFAIACLAAGIFSGFASTPSFAQAAAAQPTVSPFDKEDPEIGKLRALNWKTIDFDAQDLETRTTALLAMQQVLSMVGGKASARLELLIDYIDQNKLGEAFADSELTMNLPKLLSYEEAKKISVAFVQSDIGKQKFGDDLAGSDDATLKAYGNMYSNSSKRAYDECLEARTQVRAMGLFLQSQGKLDEFKSWAKEEMKKKQAARDAETAKLRQVAKEQEMARLEQQKEKRKQAEAAAAAKMEAYLQQQQAQGAATPPDGTGQTVYVDDGWDGDSWYPWTGAYYASDAYRGYVRDKFQDRWQNWNNRPGGGGGGTPKVRGGGGRRGRR
jgi:hypothetical protein